MSKPSLRQHLSLSHGTQIIMGGQLRTPTLPSHYPGHTLSQSFRTDSARGCSLVVDSLGEQPCQCGSIPGGIQSPPSQNGNEGSCVQPLPWWEKLRNKLQTRVSLGCLSSLACHSCDVQKVLLTWFWTFHYQRKLTSTGFASYHRHKRWENVKQMQTT